MTNWDELKETRWIIAVSLIQHDLSHAGEINHLRALHQIIRQIDFWMDLTELAKRLLLLDAQLLRATKQEQGGLP